MQKAPKRPQLAEDALQQKIDDLEFNRSTTSLSLNEEKSLLKEIEGLKAKKSQVLLMCFWKHCIHLINVRYSVDLIKIHRFESILHSMKKWIQ